MAKQPKIPTDESSIRKELKATEKFVDKVISRIEGGATDINDLMKDFDSYKTKVIMEFADDYKDLIPQKERIIAKTKKMVEMVGLLDITDSENKFLLKEASKKNKHFKKLDPNGVIQELYLKEIKLFGGIIK